MPIPKHDADDTQPFPNPRKPSNREYIPATWAAPGAGGGHPKLAGGYSVDVHTGELVPNAYNRPTQVYELTQSELLARRSARADAEYADTVINLGPGGLYEVRSRSGNNYDVNSTLSFCDCPDWLRIDNSGYGIVRCKHIYMVMLALADPDLQFGPPWSCAKWAEETGTAERTAQELCELGFIIATKKHNVWQIEADLAAFLADLYNSTIRVVIDNLTGNGGQP